MRPPFKRLDTMDPLEVRVWTHDFADDLAPGETVNSAILSLNVTVDFALPGASDPSPNNIKDGVATISGTKLVQGISNPVHGIDYELKAEVKTSTNRELVGGAILPVRNL